MTTAMVALTSGAALLPRPNAGVLALLDDDRADFLQRMTTNNINVLQPGQAAVTVLTSPTARIVHVFTVLCRADDLLLLPAPSERAVLEKHLRGKIFFMDKVRVLNRSDDFVTMRLTGAQAQATLLRAQLPVPAGDDQWLEADGVTVLAQAKFDAPGYVILASAARADEVQQVLESAGALAVDETAWAAHRVQLGRPAAGAELTPDFTPLEVGLAWACAENKGCYTGQEIIARQQTYDKVTRTLVRVRSDAPLALGMALSAEGRDVGIVTSVAQATDGSHLALAVVKRPYHAQGARLQAGDVAVQVEAA